MSKRTQALADIFVQGISEGETLSQLCRDNDISRAEVYRWQDDDAELARRIACARVKGFDAIAEQCLDIAEDASADYVDTENGPRLNAEHVQRSKLRIETRLKLLAKWDPKRYGDKVQIGGDPDGAPLKTESTVTLTAAEAYKRMLGGDK